MGGGLFYGVLYITCMSIALGQDEELFPVTFNLASRAKISVNATCGETKGEVFCKLVEHVRIFPAENRHCDICDARSLIPAQRHPILNAIDGSNRWWQSPTLTNGKEFNYVTITLDLGQVYQVAYVILKAANSPRPGNWILERSLDGTNYKPWQYFATSGRECMSEYGLEPTYGVPTALGDDQVICTTRHSQPLPLEDGEILISLVNGRPGINNPSQVLLDFTSARFIQMRFQKIRTLNADLMTFQLSDDLKNLDPSVTRRYYYSIKDISIGGHCICYGHAQFCGRHDRDSNRLKCQCEDNTCGDNCEMCCPGYHQKAWNNAHNGIKHVCERCNCHGKAEECVFNATVQALGNSLNMEGVYEGGGVCLNCKEYTTGVNCEKCISGYYRPRSMSPDDSFPCRRCNCQETRTSTSMCVPDNSLVSEGMKPGDCICKPGFAGRDCNKCEFGYYGFPNCRICPCNPAGSANPEDCRRRCRCKANVEGQHCDQCKTGYYNLDRDNPDGCTKCYCHGVSSVCKSTDWGLSKVNDMMGWVLSTREPGGLTLLPRMIGTWLEAKTYLLNGGGSGGSGWPVPKADILYWVAPMMFLGNRLTSYGGKLSYTIKYTIDNNLDLKYHLQEPDIIIQGNGITVVSGKKYLREMEENMMMVRLHESDFRKLVGTGNNEREEPVTKEEFMFMLQGLMGIMIRASYHTAQDTVLIRDVTLDTVSPIAETNLTLPSVEQCECPLGYAGLSCESCAPGYRRLNNTLYEGTCLRCNCFNHAMHCDPVDGKCLECQHNTMGAQCNQCFPGYYGDPRRGTPEDCKPCACPHQATSDNILHKCEYSPTPGNRDDYRCLSCPEGQTGRHCDKCAPGYYGDPERPGGSCRPCYCSGNIDMTNPRSCDPVTGACLECSNNTRGEYCQHCREGFYGSAQQGNCRECNCYQNGSYTGQCDERSGQCRCKPRYSGRQCNTCQPGYGDIANGCPQCQCSRIGSTDLRCSTVTGQCPCRPGIGGLHCDQCKQGMYGYNQGRCRDCECYERGTNGNNRCDQNSGQCECHPHVTGRKCDQCENGYWGLNSGMGCLPCDCNRIGSTQVQCDVLDGQCACRANVGGKNCDQCLPGFYGFNFDGCKRCEPCDLPGHICDPRTGKCVCPPNTKGPRCEECIDNSWGFNKTTGCRRCNCSSTGSVSLQCDAVDGSCNCLPDFEGYSCNKCLFGFYDFPTCGECMCSTNGTIADTCRNDDKCRCDRRGICKCKRNVEGPKCDKCRRNTFSLDIDNPNGCTACYCFGRSRTCSQAPYVWITISAETMRKTISQRGADMIVDMYGYHVLPGGGDRATVPDARADKPLYWSLPSDMLGDKILSYNGRLDFVHYFESDNSLSGGSPTTEDHLSPLVVLVGNGFILNYNNSRTLEPRQAGTYTARLHENFWRIPGRSTPVSRALLMVVLQNLEAILVKASNDGYTTYAELGPLSLQVAEPAMRGTVGETALGVELCDCPDRYSGTSCQNPGDGYFREKQNGTNDLSQPEIAIGRVRRCRCHGHSDSCDPETGICLICKHNTTGPHCDQCSPGYYGVATRGSPWDCSPCACPHPEASNSTTCDDRSGMLTCTNCSEGHTGTRCERCLPGYYGNPIKIGDRCKPCNCNPEGSLSTACDFNTGRCDCRPGIEGFKCDSCNDYGFAVQNGSCVSCFDGCTGVLLTDIANMSVPLKIRNISIPLPWNELLRIRNETKDLQELVDRSKAASLTDILDYKNQTEFFDEVADRLIERVDRTQRRIAKADKEASQMQNNATALERNVKKVFEDIKSDIGNLVALTEKLFNNQAGVNITAAFKEAQRILDEILGRDFSRRDQAAKNEKKLAEKLKRRVQRLHDKNVNTSEVAKNLEGVLAALQDLRNRSEKAKDLANKVMDEEALALAAQLANLLDKHQQIEDKAAETEDILKDGKDFIDDAKSFLDRLIENLDTLDRRYTTLDAITDRLGDIYDDLDRSLPVTEDKVNRAWRHAEELAKYAKELDELFAKTRADAEDPVKAAKVYQDIVKAIKEAEEAANDALKNAKDAVQIAGVDRIKDEVEDSIRRSRELQRQADRLLDTDVTDLEDDLIYVQGDVDKVERLNNNNQDKLDDLNRGMARLPSDLRNRLDDVEDELDRTGRKARRTKKRVDDIIDKMNNEMRPKIDDLGRTVGTDMYDIGYKTNLARDNVKKIKGIIGDVGAIAGRTKQLSQNISYNIIQLKENIRQARELANNMKLSMKGDGKCVRSYRSESQPGATNDISFGFKRNDTRDNMLLVLLQKSTTEFLAVELVKNKIRFTWDNGGGQGSVTHNLTIQLRLPDDPEDKKWYRVHAQRIGRIGLLKVYGVDKSESKALELSGTSPGGYSVLKLDQNSDVLFGGVNANVESPRGITRQNMTGSIGDMKIDGKPIGMFNFKSTAASCNASNEIPSKPVSTNEYYFDGTGYSETDRGSGYRSDRTRISFSFKTYWENAILHFSGDQVSGDFISVELREGKIMLQFYNGGMSHGQGITSKTYNNNKWTKVSIDKKRLAAALSVNDERVLINAPGKNKGLDLKNHPFYFGGIPASMDLTSFKKISNLETNKFLGCMKDIIIGNDVQNLFSGTVVGISAGCRDAGIRKAGFYGDGFAIFKASGLEGNEADVSVSFITKQSDAMLLLALDTNDNYYSLALNGGRIEGRFGANGKTVHVISDDIYNDELLHNIAIVKMGRKLTMYVDDQLADETDLPIGVDSIPMDPITGRLYIGGVPQNFDVADKVASSVGLDGCTSDIIVNGQLLNFNLPVQYMKADIGRCPYDLNSLFSFNNTFGIIGNAGIVPRNTNDFLAPPPAITTTTTTTTRRPTTRRLETTPPPLQTTELETTAMALSTSPEPQDCARSEPNEKESGAYVFGNDDKSYALIKFRKREVTKTFNISFDFRTFYADGLFFLLTNPSRSDYLVVQLQNGEVVLSYSHKGDHKSIRTGRRLGDGQWHSVIVNKGSRRIFLKVEGRSIKENIARRLDVIAPMYVGGLPGDYPSEVKNLVPHSIRGCLRNFTINNDIIAIGNTKVISGTGPCTKNVEPGAYFNGFSWGIYAIPPGPNDKSETFHIGQFLEISLEFRTNELDGILVTISSEDGVIGMTLELHLGKVKFTVKNGESKFTAVSKNQNPYKVCDHNWHKVRADVIRNVVQITVDNWETEYGPSPGVLRQTPTDNPLFIGGTMANFPQAAASTTKGFKGCIRNLKIDDNPVDWYKLIHMKGIRRTACPTY